MRKKEREKEMGIFESIINFASMGVMAWGAVYAITGLITFSEGHKQQSAPKKEEGMGSIVGGGVIFAIGMFLVPQILDLLQV